MTLSPQIKLLALVGGLAAVALAAGMFFLSRQPATVEVPIPAPAAHPAAKAAVAPTAVGAKPKARAASPVAANGVPVAIVRQLAKHRVVVVSVYADDAHVDTLARDEARAGARDARTGFAAVDVGDRRLAKALADGPKELNAPDVLVFERGSGVVQRFHGFADRTLVAQLAASAR
jgi:hypothetical protein